VGYSLHIERPERPFTPDTWVEEVAAVTPGRFVQAATAVNPVTGETIRLPYPFGGYELVQPDGTVCGCLILERTGRLSMRAPRDSSGLAPLVRLATQLGGQLVGDEGERYGTDDSPVRVSE